MTYAAKRDKLAGTRHKALGGAIRKSAPPTEGRCGSEECGPDLDGASADVADAGAPASASAERRARRASRSKYTTYVARIFRDRVDGGAETIAASAVDVTCQLLDDLERRLTERAFGILKLSKRRTLTESHVRGATRIVVPRVLASDVVHHANKIIGDLQRASVCA
ncbi:hypothetical protein AB1Y20_010328 [Prymnesium parvum]|uniref:Core Histone H2A/H2B/H3 domain-containing protein n=1 Tax=Prymnesium parvum TaxID=97485 RepID=A0AB34K741_PRYPA